MKSEDVWKVIHELRGADTQVDFIACIPQSTGMQSESLRLVELV